MSVCRREQQPHAQAEMTASVAPGPDALQKSSPLFWAWTRHLQTNVRQTGGGTGEMWMSEPNTRLSAEEPKDI